MTLFLSCMMGDWHLEDENGTKHRSYFLPDAFWSFCWKKWKEKILRKYTYVLLIEEVILSFFTRTSHILQQGGHVPLPIIHYHRISEPFSKESKSLFIKFHEHLHMWQIAGHFVHRALIDSTIYKWIDKTNRSIRAIHRGPKLFPTTAEIGGKRTRSDATLSCHRPERKRKNSCGLTTCPLLPARIQKTY